MANPVNLDDILIITQVREQWNELAARAAAVLPYGISPSDIGDEEAEIHEDGSLRIFCSAKGERLAQLRIPTNQWQWRFPKN